MFLWTKVLYKNIKNLSVPEKVSSSWSPYHGAFLNPSIDHPKLEL